LWKSFVAAAFAAALASSWFWLVIGNAGFLLVFCGGLFGCPGGPVGSNPPPWAEDV
jgi:hypothetical protein